MEPVKDTKRKHDMDTIACLHPLEGFLGEIAHAIERLGSDDFPLALDKVIRALISYDNSMLFAYAPGKRPIGVYTNIDNVHEAAIIIDKYVLGPYLLDPFFEEVRAGRTSGIAHLAAIAPDEFSQTEYFERHYRRTRISDEIGFFMGLPGDVTAVLSITRRGGDDRFCTEEVEILRRVADLICALGQRHWADARLRFEDAVGSKTTSGQTNPGPIEETLLGLKKDTLSDRQAEIIGYLLRGHSTGSIALHLDISAETVKVHRRNAYANLGISSQAELFSIFIEQLSSMITARG